MTTLHSIHIGRPQAIHDEHGTWRSSIYRTLVDGPVELGVAGLEGDEVTDTRHHGKPNQAVCCHLVDHYRFWNERYGMSLHAGDVGENWTLADADEAEICVHDVYDVGTARVQVSGPRVPCSTQSRRVGRKDWVELTLRELRTGFYLTVVRPGTVRAGDAWRLIERPYAGATLFELNRCAYRGGQPDVAARFLRIPDLDAYWLARLNGARPE